MYIAISIFTSLGFYLWSIFYLPKLSLNKDRITVYSVSRFKSEFPNGERIIFIHNFLSFFIFVGFFAYGIFLGIMFFPKPLGEISAMWFSVAGWNLFNGFFEITTKVSPEYGILIKRHSSQGYRLGDGISKLGWIRMILSVLIITIIFLFRFFIF